MYMWCADGEDKPEIPDTSINYRLDVKDQSDIKEY